MWKILSFIMEIYFLTLSCFARDSPCWIFMTSTTRLNLCDIEFRTINLSSTLPYRMENFFRIREIPFPALTTDCWMLCEVRGFASIYSPILKFDKFIHSHFSIFALCHAFMFHLSHYILQRISISQHQPISVLSAEGMSSGTARHSTRIKYRSRKV